MAQASPSINQITIAALTVPLVVLVVTLSIDSVEKQDSVEYRKKVGTWGVATLISAFLLIVVAVIGELSGQLRFDLFIYFLATLLFTLVLTLTVVIHELFRGIEFESRGSSEMWARIFRVFILVGGFHAGLMAYYAWSSSIPVILVILFLVLLWKIVDVQVLQRGDSGNMKRLWNRNEK